MIEYETRVKTWGNSFGIVIPKEKLREANVKLNQGVKVTIKPIKALTVKDIFGKVKGWNRSTKTILKDIDKELDSKFIR